MLSFTFVISTMLVVEVYPSLIKKESDREEKIWIPACTGMTIEIATATMLKLLSLAITLLTYYRGGWDYNVTLSV